MKKPKKTSVYDWPTRIFHGLFAVLFLAAFIIAQTVDDENSIFSLHMLAGLTMLFLLVLRLIWGFIGTTYARFSSFRLNPVELLQYFKEAVIKKTRRYLGHNPASSYAAVIMFISAIGLAVTGILMAGSTESDFYEEAHELLANVFLITVILHVAGIIFHQFKHRDGLWWSMVDGKKESLPGKWGINSSRLAAGILFLILTLAWSGYLYSNYNRTTQTLNFFGNELVLGEEEHEDRSLYEEESQEQEDDEN